MSKTLREHNIALVDQYFSAIRDGRWDDVEACYHDDIVVHMAGTTPASGRLEGKAAVTDDLIARTVMAKLVPGKMQFARQWKVMCADDERVTVIMEGGGPTVSGDVYDQLYCEIFAFSDDRIIEMHVFLDTALLERALFDNPTRERRQPPEKPFAY